MPSSINQQTQKVYKPPNFQPVQRIDPRPLLALFPDSAILPVIHKAAYFWDKYQNKPGIHGNYNGATGIAVLPTIGSRLAFGEYDDPDLNPIFLATIPRLAETFDHERDDHGSFAVRFPRPVDYDFIPWGDGRKGERFSLRTGGGHYQIVAGRHFIETPPKSNCWEPSGYSYINNGKPAIDLTESEAAALLALIASLKPVKPAPTKIVPFTPRSDVSLETVSSEQTRALFNLKYIDPGDPRNDWIRVGGALKDVFGDSGQFIFDQWSSGSPSNYKPGEIERAVWKSLRLGLSPETAGKTLAKLANEASGGRAAREWFEAQRAEVVTPALEPEPVPDIPQIDEFATPAPAPADRHVATWGSALSTGRRAVLMEVYGKAGEAVALTIDTILLKVGEQKPFTLTDLSPERSRRIERAFNEYGLSRLCRRSDRMITPSPTIDKEGDHSVPTPSTAENSATYILPDPGAFWAKLYEQVIYPFLCRRYYKLAPDMLHKVSIELLSLASIDDPEIVKAINARLDAKRTREERQASECALAHLDALKAKWNDTTPAPLPVTRTGKDWTKDYKGAQATANALRVIQDKGSQSWSAAHEGTGMNRATLTRTEHRAGIVREKRIVSQVIRPGQRLPDRFDPDLKGMPVRAESEELERFNLCDESDQARARAALASGLSLRIDYQQESGLRFMTEDELAAQQARKITRPTAQKKPALSIERRDEKPVTIGYSLSYLLRWLDHAETRFKLSSGELSTKDRIYRLAGREVQKTEPVLSPQMREETPMHTTREEFADMPALNKVKVAQDVLNARLSPETVSSNTPAQPLPPPTRAEIDKANKWMREQFESAKNAPTKRTATKTRRTEADNAFMEGLFNA